LHQVGEYQLTMDHMNTYLMMSMLNKGISDKPSVDETNHLGKELVQFFKEDPKGANKLLYDFNQRLSDLESQFDKLVTNSSVTNIEESIYPETSAAGHRMIREILGSDIGEMNFQSEGANAPRTYLYNSLLSSKSNHFDSGITGSHYEESEIKIQLCPDGSFTQINSGYMSIGVEGMDLSRTGGDDIMRGYWDVSTIPSGLHFILFYSADHGMLEDSPNGFLPFPVSSYD